MAILEPSIDIIRQLKVQPTEGEWTLLNFLLENLDNSYEIYFQPFLNGDNPDFVIMRKGSGVLIIEVKDWDLQHYHIDTKTQWYLSKDETHIKSPLKQVDEYKENLYQLHCEDLFLRNVRDKRHWAIVGCSVYFHNVTKTELTNFLLEDFQTEKHDSYRDYIDHFGLLGRDSLNEPTFNELLTRFWINKRSYFFDDTLYKSIRRYLKQPLHEEKMGIKIYYTKAQLELARSEIRPRRKVKGVPGSGKTLVLAKRAVNAHLRTKGKVLILTFNLSLKNYIHDRISDVREDFNWSNFQITNYHQFFKTQANNYNLEIEGEKDWDNEYFFESVKNRITKFDVILIDEIQDYLQNWIDIVTRYFTHNDTEFVVFGDEKQNIYNRELDENNEPIVRTIPGVWNKTLNTTHRLSNKLGLIALKFQETIFDKKYNLDDMRFLPQLEFEESIIEYHAFENHSIQCLFEIIFDILERNEIHSSDTGVLCSKVELLRELDFLIRTKKNEKTTTTFESNEDYESLKEDDQEIKKLRRTKKNFFWMKTGTIKLSTTHSFKGWEINTLFLIIEKEDPTKGFTNDELIYTALTRAKRNLIVFNLGNPKYDVFFKNEIPIYYKHNENTI